MIDHHGVRSIPDFTERDLCNATADTFGKLPYLCFIISVPDYRIVYLNEVTTDLLTTIGIEDTEEVIRKHPWDIFPNWNEVFLPAYEEVRTSGDVRRLKDIRYQIDGPVLYWDIALVPNLDEDQEITSISAIGVDVTDLMESKQALESTVRDRQHIAALESIAEAGLSTLDLDALLNALVEHISKGLNSHSCHIMALDEKSGQLVTQAVYNVPPLPIFRTEMTEGFVGKIYTERRTIYIADAQTGPLVTNPEFRHAGVRSLLGTPLVVRGKIVGVVYIDMDEVYEFSADEISLFEAMAARAALAIENAVLYGEVARGRKELEYALDRERHSSRVLQRALLPTKPSIAPGYSVADVYVPAFAGQEIGGDFYDVFPTKGGKVAIMIGDVSGKGLESASLAAATRSTVRAFAYDIPSVGGALTHANAVLYDQQPEYGYFVTAFLAILNPATGRMCYANAGHPPAAIYRAQSGDMEFMSYGNPPVGLVTTQEFSESEAWLEPGDRIIFYTDGVSEARHGIKMFGMEGIEDTIRQYGRLSSHDLAESLLDAAHDWANGKLTDDVAIIVVGRESAPEAG